MVGAANHRQWEKLTDAIGEESLKTDPRFLTNQDRIKNRPSRFDRKFLVDSICAESRRVFLEDLCQRVPEDLDLPKLDVRKVVKVTEGLTIAHVKEIFLSVVVLGISLDEAVSAARGSE